MSPLDRFIIAPVAIETSRVIISHITTLLQKIGFSSKKMNLVEVEWLMQCISHLTGKTKMIKIKMLIYWRRKK